MRVFDIGSALGADTCSSQELRYHPCYTNTGAVESKSECEHLHSPFDRRRVGAWPCQRLINIASEMVHSLIPMVMVTTLNASAVTIGLFKG